MKKQAEILKEAFAYQGQLTAYAYVVLQDWALAEDVIQDLFVTVTVKWESFDQQKALYPWLKRIARNRAIDIIRSRSREFYCQGQILLDLVDLSFDEGDAQRSLEGRRLMTSTLRTCIDGLNQLGKDLIRAFYSEGKNCASIASELDRSENSIYISLTRIRQKLRKCTDEKLALEDF